MVIEGSKPIEDGPSVRPLAGADWWIVATAALLFGGVAGAWYAPTGIGGSWFQALRLSSGVVVLALAVAGSGTLICGRNAIRWGVGMPLAAYFAGTLLAVAAGQGQAMGLVFGAPVFAGLTIAAGLVATYAVDGLARSLRRSS